MALPDLSTVCKPVEIRLDPESLCIMFPGGSQVCAQIPDLGVPDPLEGAKQLLAQANAAMAPLTPVFNIIDVVIQVQKCIEAIPDSLGPPPDPTAIAECIPCLAEKVSKLLKLIPQLSVPFMILGVIDAILTFLDGAVAQLRAIVVQAQAIANAATRAEELGNAQLQIVADCAQAGIDAQLVSLSQSAAPINRLIGLANLFMELAGLEPLPTLDDFGDEAEPAINKIAELIEKLQAVRDTIPV